MDRPGIEEEDLLQRVQAGDAMAFEAIYRKHAPWLSAKLLLLLKDDELARDILQDIFIKVWDMRAMIRPEQSFASLLYTMATNLSYNTFRKAARDMAMRNALYPEEETYSHIEEAIEQKETGQILRDAVSRLPARQREIYTLHKLEGKSYREISALLSISDSAINHHIQLANKQLRAILQPGTVQILAFLSASLLAGYK